MLAGVNEDCDLYELKVAWKRAMKQFHPDRCIDMPTKYAENLSQRVNQAYQILSNNTERDKYDMHSRKEIFEKYGGL